MRLFGTERNEPQYPEHRDKEIVMDTALGAGKDDAVKTDSAEKSVQYLFDLNSLEKEVAQKVECIVAGETRGSFCSKCYVLYAWQCEYGNTYCVFAELLQKAERFRICTPYLKDGIIHLQSAYEITFEEFYAFDKEELFRRAFGLRRSADIGPLGKEKIWEALMKIFPDYASKKTVRTAIFEKYVPYQLDDYVGAEDYSNRGILYKMLRPIGPHAKEMMEIQQWAVTDRGKETESVKRQDTFCFAPYPKTEEEFERYVANSFLTHMDRLLLVIPHRQIWIDDRSSINCGSMLFEADYRELHIYQSKSDTSRMILRKYSVYNGRPQEGGRMEGYTFHKVIEIPSERCQWTDEQLIAEYQQYFG